MLHRTLIAWMPANFRPSAASMAVNSTTAGVVVTTAPRATIFQPNIRFACRSARRPRIGQRHWSHHRLVPSHAPVFGDTGDDQFRDAHRFDTRTSDTATCEHLGFTLFDNTPQAPPSVSYRLATSTDLYFPMYAVAHSVCGRIIAHLFDVVQGLNQRQTGSLNVIL